MVCPYPSALENHMKAPAVFQIKKLCLYREVSILEGLDWKVRSGEHWVLLGPNGSGKSSLLSALCAYLTPSSGEMWLLGKKYGRSDWRELRKKIGIVSSSLRPMFREDETAFRMVVSGGQAMLNYWGTPSPCERRRALVILRQVECSALADRPWGVLSQGEQQRVMIGRALMARHRVLFLDEPCAGLDLVARARFLTFLQKLAVTSKYITMVLVTHHVEEILPAFSHVMLLAQGRMVASGKKGDVLKNENLSRAYGAKIKVSKKAGRYEARLFETGNKSSLFLGQ